MKKPGLFFRGYDSKRDLASIDKPIRPLIKSMNNLPNISTHGSCAGHKPLKEDNKGFDLRYVAVVDFEIRRNEEALEDLLARLCYKGLLDYPKSYTRLTKFFMPSYQERASKAKRDTGQLRLVWSYRLEINGEGNTKKEARNNLDGKIKELEQFFNEESKK